MTTHEIAVERYGLFIGGERREARSGATFTRENPYDGTVVAEYANADEADAEEAVALGAEDVRRRDLGPRLRPRPPPGAPPRGGDPRTRPGADRRADRPGGRQAGRAGLGEVLASGGPRLLRRPRALRRGRGDQRAGPERARPDPQGADRRGRDDHRLELPAGVDPQQARARAGRRLHRGAQAVALLRRRRRWRWPRRSARPACPTASSTSSPPTSTAARWSASTWRPPSRSTRSRSPARPSPGRR